MTLVVALVAGCSTGDSVEPLTTERVGNAAARITGTLTDEEEVFRFEAVRAE